MENEIKNTFNLIMIRLFTQLRAARIQERKVKQEELRALGMEIAAYDRIINDIKAIDSKDVL